MKKINEENNQNQPNNISGNFKQALGETFKKLITIMLPIIIIIVILAAVIWFIFDDEGSWKDDEPGKPSTYTSNTTIDTSQGIKVNKEPIIEENLKSLGYEEEKINKMTEQEVIEALKLSEKLGRNVRSLDDCTQAEILWCCSDEYARYLENPEQLEYLLNAELVTQFPKINSVSTDKINGIIEFQRIQTDESIGNEQKNNLQYISESEFNKKYENYKNNGNTEIFKYFTLDNEKNVVIATWTEESGIFESNNTTKQNRRKIKAGYDEQRIKDEYDSRYVVKTNEIDLISAEYKTYQIEKKKINYRSMVGQYTLPFEYLWALLVMGESYEFVENLAGLAYESQITIGIYDSITTTVNTDKQQYTESFRERYEKYEKEEGVASYTLVSQTNWTDPVETYSYYAKNEKTVKYNTPQIDVIYANTWLLEMTLNYNNVISDAETVENPQNIDDENWSDNGSSTNNYTETRTRWIYEVDEETGMYLHVTAEGMPIPTPQNYTVYIQEKFYREKKTTGQNINSILDIHYNKYEKGQPTVIEKTNVEGEADNFVEFLKQEERAYGLLTDIAIVGWLTDVLEENESTVNMVDLTLYLLNKTTGTTDYIDEDKISFDDIWTSIVIANTPVTSVGFDYVVDTSKSSENLVIKDKDVLKNIINQVYTGDKRTNLLSAVDAFLEIQESYNVNAVFAIAVTQIESSCGTDFSGAIAANTYNWMSMTGSYNGNTYKNPNSSNERTWRVYSSFSEATLDFGNIIANGNYYFQAGKYTVTAIAPTYCSESWGESVIAIMTKIYSAAGISTFSGDLTLTGGVGGTQETQIGDGYKSVFHVGTRTYKNFKQTQGSWSSNSDIKNEGCGLTCAAIVLSGYGFQVTPKDMYDVEFKWRTKLYNLLKIPFQDYVYDDIRNGVITQLIEGKPVIVHVRKNTENSNYLYGSNAGHYIALLSINEEGNKIYVSDPAGDCPGKGRNGWVPLYKLFAADENNKLYIDSYIKL